MSYRAVVRATTHVVVYSILTNRVRAFEKNSCWLAFILGMWTFPGDLGMGMEL